MATLNDLLKVFKDQRDAIYQKGGVMNIKGTNVSPNDILQGIKSIPQSVFQTDSYSIMCTETANTTFTISRNGVVIDIKTNDETIGGSVVFNVTETGTYVVVATQNDLEKWTTTVGVADMRTIILKSPKPIREYSENEIDLAAKNNYAKYMFNVFDYRDDESFNGSTSTSYVRRYILGFDDYELADGSGYSGIVWYYPRTSKTYKYNDTSTNNTSWEGSYLRHNCFLKNGSEYYAYDSTVTDTTEGTYYTQDSNGNWIERILPAEYVSTEDYYKRQVATADGEIWTGILKALRDRMVQVKTKTWRGHTNNGKKMSYKNEDEKILISKDYIFPLSCQEAYGDRPEIGRTSNSYWGYNQNEGSLLSSFKETGKRLFNYYSDCASNQFWLRSPCTNSAPTGCYWYHSNGNVSSYTVTSALAVGVCFCQ